MKINFYATLRHIVGQKTIDLWIDHPISVRDLVAEIVKIHPGLRVELLDADGNIYQHVHVLVNGRDSIYLDGGNDAVVTQNDTINIFPAVGGG
jgi:molybdopterin synthase sulfur carrier subunit